MFAFLEGGRISAADKEARDAGLKALRERRQTTPEEKAKLVAMSARLEEARAKREAAKDTPEQRKRNRDAEISNEISQRELAKDPFVRVRVDPKNPGGYRGIAVRQSQAHAEADKQFGDWEQREHPARAALRSINDHLIRAVKGFTPDAVSRVLPQESHLHDDTDFSHALDRGVTALHGVASAAGAKVHDADHDASAGGGMYRGGGLAEQRLSHADFVTDLPAPPVPRKGGLNSNGISDFGTRRFSMPDLGYTPQARSHWVPVSDYPDELDGRHIPHTGYDDIPEDESDDSSSEEDSEFEGGAILPRRAARRKKEYLRALQAEKAALKASYKRQKAEDKFAHKVAHGLVRPGNPLLEDHPGLGVAQPGRLGAYTTLSSAARAHYTQAGRMY